MQGWSCLSLDVEYADLLLVLSESELVVSCKMGEDGRLLVVLGSLVGDMGSAGWLLTY